MTSSPPGRLPRMLGVAAAYLMAAKLGLTVAIPPGYASALWPAAGVALAAVLLLGARVWPGILLGSFLANLATGFDTGGAAAIGRSILLPLVIGAGATLQALVGARWMRRSGEAVPRAPFDERDVQGILLLGGPLSCLASATLGVIALLLAGRIAASAAPFSWLTWWIGDTLGVILVTPLILLWASRDRLGWQRKAVATGLLTLAFGAVLTVTGYVTRLEQERARREIEHLADLLLDDIENHDIDDVEFLHSVEGLYAGSDTVERREFTEFVAHALPRLSDYTSVGWVPRVSADRRAAFEAEQRTAGLPEFRIWQYDEHGRPVPATGRTEYFPYLYIAPGDDLDRGFGFDVASEPRRRAALERARDTGAVSATPCLNLISNGAVGFLVVLPIYVHGPLPATVEERRRRLQGFAVGVFEIARVTRGAVAAAREAQVELRLSDVTVEGRSTLLVQSPGALPGSDPRPNGEAEFVPATEVLEFADRRWCVECRPSADYLESRRSLYSWVALTGGLLVTALVGALVLLLLGRTIRTAELVDLRTAELRDANRDLRQEIATRERVEVELRAATQAAESATRTKSEFLANMSHEIRTPMNAIIGMADLLSQTSLDADQRYYVDTFRDAGADLLRLLDDILDFSKIEAGQVALEVTDFDLFDLVERTAAIFAHRAHAKCIELSTRIAPEVPHWVRGDPLRLRQVLVNLVGNAVKFTDAGRVTVEVERGGEENGPGALCVRVRDTGIGISAEQQEAIFARFVQADSSVTRKYGGTGLGLAISRRLVELMGGTIRVESRPEQGSTFTFTVRLGIAAAPSDSVAERPADTRGTRVRVVEDDTATSAGLPPLRVLLVDDTPENRLVVQAYLKGTACRVDTVTNGEEGVRAAAASKYDVILMDVQMPEMDGFAATREIRRRERERGGACVPIFALTAYAMKEDVANCFAAGCTGHLAKPLRRQALLEALRGIAPGGAGSAGAGAATSVRAPAAAGAAFDRAAALAQLGGDAGLMVDLARIFVAQAAARRDAIRAAVERGDAAALHEGCHALKGAALQLAARRLAATLDDLVHTPAAVPLAAFERELQDLVAALESIDQKEGA